MPERIRFEAGRRVLLAPLLARHITVTALPKNAGHGAVSTLASIRPGTTAVVTATRVPAVDSSAGASWISARPGTRITPELDSLTGNPRAYQVRGTLVALRKEQADQIFVHSGAGAA
jgi:DtxR family Mn-dependent transcriptional regulator